MKIILEREANIMRFKSGVKNYFIHKKRGSDTFASPFFKNLLNYPLLAGACVPYLSIQTT
jgi:hypothetical protein